MSTILVTPNGKVRTQSRRRFIVVDWGGARPFIAFRTDDKVKAVAYVRKHPICTTIYDTEEIA